MKIAFVVHDYQREGVGQTRYVGELARRFSGDHDVHIFANRIETDGSERINFHHVPSWRRNALTNLLSYAATSTLMVGRDFDIVHSQGFCGFYGNIFTAHICSRAWHRAIDHSDGGATVRERIFNAFAIVLEYATYHRSDQREVIAVSDRVATDIQNEYDARAPIHVIHHGVDLTQFAPQDRAERRRTTRKALGIDEDEFVFLYVGNLRKGARQALHALSRMERGTLVLVSATSAQPYRDVATKRGLNDRTRFVGFTREIQSYYAAADAFVLPSPYDSFGMVVTEAMAAGIPVIVSREAGASELIRPGENGFVLNDLASETELAALMRSLLDDRSRANEMGEAGRRSVDNLTWDAVAASTMRVYEGLLKKKS